MARLPKRAVAKADAKIAQAAKPVAATKTMQVLGAISDVADQPPLYRLSAAVAVVGLLSGNKRLRRAGLRMFASEWLATKLKSAIKHRVDRNRPNAVEEGSGNIRRGKSKAKELNSFPSGHTAGAVAVAQALSREYPEYRAAATAVAATAAVLQIPRCHHYPTDIAAGAGIGLIAEAIVNAVAPARGEDDVGGANASRR